MSLSPVDFEIADLSEVPWSRYSWSGEIVSVDGASAEDNITSSECVRRIIAWGTSEIDSWDGECAGVVELVDGRFCAWESGWGPTGSGFHHDAYGGDADIIVASSLSAPLLQALSERSTDMLVFATNEGEQPLIDVLCDAIEQNATRPVLMEIAKSSGEFGDIYRYRVDDIVRRWRPA